MKKRKTYIKPLRVKRITKESILKEKVKDNIYAYYGGKVYSQVQLWTWDESGRTKPEIVGYPLGRGVSVVLGKKTGVKYYSAPWNAHTNFVKEKILEDNKKPTRKRDIFSYILH